MKKPRVIIFMLAGIALCLSSVLVTYFGLMAMKVIPQDLTEITYTIHGDTKEYDGLALEPSDYELTAGELGFDHHIKVMSVSSQIEVGSSEARAELKVLDEKEEDVSSLYKIKYVYETLTVTPRSIQIKLEDSTKLSNQEVLKEGEYELVQGELLFGHKLVPYIEKTIENGIAKYSTTMHILDAYGLDVTNNYTVSFQTENDTLELIPLTIKPTDMVVEYSRKALDLNTVEVEQGYLLPGHYILAEVNCENAFEIGEYQSDILSYKILDVYGNDASKYYSVTTTSGVVEITKRSLLITTPDITKEYTSIALTSGEREELGELKIEGLIEGDRIFTEYDTSRALIDCGVYDNIIPIENVQVTAASMDVTDYYDVTLVYGSITITPKEIDIEWEDLYLEYNEEVQRPDYTLVGVFTNDSGVVLNYNGNQNVGTYEEELRLNTDNYVLSTSTVVYTIYPREVFATWTNTELTYNGALQRPTLSLSETINVSYSPAMIHAGEHDMTIESLDPNYYISENSKIVTYTISPLQITATLSESSLTYNAQEQAPNIELRTIITGDVVNASIEKKRDVGDYNNLTITLDNQDYSLSRTTGSYSIVEKEVSVSYTNSFEYNGKVPILAVSLSGVYSEDICSIIFVDDITESDAGDYTKEIEISNSNYILITNEIAYSIQAKQLTYSIDKTEFTYSGVEQGPNITVFGVLSEDNYNVEVTKEVTVGEYEAEISSSTNSNYILNITPFTYTISPREIHYVFDNSSIEYTGLEQAPSYTCTGVLENDTCELILRENVNVGVYSTTVTCTNSNYTVSNPVATYEITPMILSVTYDKYIPYTGQSQAPEIQVPTLAQGDTCNVVIEENTNVGTYISQVRVDNLNYALDITSITYEITPIEVEVTYSNSIEYDGSYQTPITGVQNIISQDTCNIYHEMYKDVGMYTIELKTDNSNYSLSVTNITYEITPIEIAVSTVTSLPYNGSNQTPITGIQNVLTQDTCLVTHEQYKDAGTYTVNLRIDNSNYVLNTTSITYTINPLAVTLDTGNMTSTLVYNGTYQAPNAVLNGVLASDVCNATIAKNRNAGTYTASVTLDNSNYAFAQEMTYSYTITRRSITIMAVDIQKYDDGQDLFGRFEIISGTLGEGDFISYDPYDYCIVNISLTTTERMEYYIDDSSAIYTYNENGVLINVSNNYIIDAISGQLMIIV